MPILDDAALRDLRDQQKRIGRCERCSAQTWKNYCRQCDEYFYDGHSEMCKRVLHKAHRRY